MRPTLYIIGVLFLSLFTAQGRNPHRPRTIQEPTHFVKAEVFTELNESDRQVYVEGLMDGFYASALFGASDRAVANLNSCTKDMDGKQLAAIISNYVKDHPEAWQLPLSIQAFNALNQACPGVLKVTDP